MSNDGTVIAKSNVDVVDDDIDAMNFGAVGAYGGDVAMLRKGPLRFTPHEAMAVAAWLVVTAETQHAIYGEGPMHSIEEYVSAVRRT